MSVGVNQCVGERIRLGTVPELRDVYLVGHDPCRLGHGSPAPERTGGARHRFVGDAVLFGDPAHSHEEHPQGVEAAFVHQRPRHDHVVDEVAGQEPLVSTNVRFGADQPEGESSAGRIHVDHAV